MPINSVTGVFSRIWKFIDQFAAGKEIERDALDVALDDLAGGVNSALERTQAVSTIASSALSKANLVESNVVALQATVEELSDGLDPTDILRGSDNLDSLQSRSLSMKNLFGLSASVATFPLQFLRVKADGSALEARSVTQMLSDLLGIDEALSGHANEFLQVKADGSGLQYLTTTEVIDALGVALASAVFGIEQQWRSMIVGTDRVLGTTYQNTSTRPIHVYLEGNTAANGDVFVSADNTNWVKVGRVNSASRESVSFPVPAGHYYRATAGIDVWSELRHPTA